MNSDIALKTRLFQTPFAELNDADRKARVQEVIEEARKIASEVGMRADYRSLVSQLEIELEITPEEAAAWLEAVEISPEEGQELEGSEEEPLPGDISGFKRLFAALAELPPDDEALDEEAETLPMPPTDPAPKPPQDRDPKRFDRFAKR